MRGAASPPLHPCLTSSATLPISLSHPADTPQGLPLILLDQEGKLWGHQISLYGAVVNAEIDTVHFHGSAKLLNHLLFLSRTPTTCICLPMVPMALELRISSLALCGTDLCGVFFFFSPYQRRMCKLASLASFLLILFYYFLPYLLIKSPSYRLPHLRDSLYSAASLTTKGGDIPLPSHFPKHATSRD